MAVVASIRVHVRLFAMQRELAGTRGLDLSLPSGATIEDAWTEVVRLHPALAPGRPALRFARNGAYAPADTGLGRGRRGCDDPAGERGGRAARRLPGSWRSGTSRSGRRSSAELGERLATPEDGAVVAFLGVTRRSPGTPAPGQEAEAARHAGRSVESLTYETHASMALAVMGEIADEIASRFGVTRLAIVHRDGEVPLGEPSVAIVACAPHRDAAFEAARYAIDETKARAPIWKAEQFERRPGLDR